MIKSHILQGKSFSLSIFLNAFSRVSLLFYKKGEISFTDLVDCVSFVSSGLGEEKDLREGQVGGVGGGGIEESLEEIISTRDKVYAGILYESILLPALVNDKPSLIIREELLGNEENYLLAIWKALMKEWNRATADGTTQNGGVGGSGGGGGQNLMAFQNSIERFLKKKLGKEGFEANFKPFQQVEPREAAIIDPPPLTIPSSASALPVPSSSAGISDFPVQEKSSLDYGNYSFQSKNLVQSPQSASMHRMNPSHMNPHFNLSTSMPSETLMTKEFPEGNHKMTANTSSRGREDMPEGLFRLLGYLRRGGMDLLFPQLVHDKILIMIFTAVRVAGPISHRELMDMIKSVRERGLISGVEEVSKTKIRSVLALLKTSLALGTLNGDGDSVRLFIGQGIQTFREFREKHDNYLHKCILQQHFYIPRETKAEFLWLISPEVLEVRVKEIHNVEVLLENYFQSGHYVPSFSTSKSSLQIQPSQVNNTYNNQPPLTRKLNAASQNGSFTNSFSEMSLNRNNEWNINNSMKAAGSLFSNNMKSEMTHFPKYSESSLTNNPVYQPTTTQQQLNFDFPYSSSASSVANPNHTFMSSWDQSRLLSFQTGAYQSADEDSLQLQQQTAEQLQQNQYGLVDFNDNFNRDNNDNNNSNNRSDNNNTRDLNDPDSFNIYAEFF